MKTKDWDKTGKEKKTHHEKTNQIQSFLILSQTYMLKIQNKPGGHFKRVKIWF